MLDSLGRTEIPCSSGRAAQQPSKEAVLGKTQLFLSGLFILFHSASATGRCQIPRWASWACDPTQDSCSYDLRQLASIVPVKPRALSQTGLCCWKAVLRSTSTAHFRWQQTRERSWEDPSDAAPSVKFHCKKKWEMMRFSERGRRVKATTSS